MTDSDGPRADRTAIGPHDDLDELAGLVGCSACEDGGLCSSCLALASLIQAEVRVREQRRS